MAVTAHPSEHQTETLVNDIKVDLKSASTTSATTLNLLRAVLGLESNETKCAPSKKSQMSATARRKPGPRSAASKTLRPPKGSSRPVNIYNGTQDKIPTLSVASRKKLATEAFNHTLKTLTEAAKAKQACGSTLQSQTGKDGSKKQIRSVQPLNPSSSNNLRKPGGQLAVIKEDISTTAECASTALQFLRNAANDEKQADEKENLQVEKGALVLLDKLLTLELVQHAQKEASKIYEQYWKRRKETSISGENGKEPSIAQWMQAGIAIQARDEFSWTTSFQGQLFRLLVLLGTKCLDVQLLAALHFEYPGSPAWVVAQGQKLGHLTVDKAGSQLHTIYQAMAKLYMMCSDRADIETRSKALVLGLLREALIVKCHAWNLTRHKPDLNRELWAQASHGIKHFISSTPENTTTHDNTIYDFVESLQRALEVTGFVTTLPLSLSKYTNTRVSDSTKIASWDHCSSTRLNPSLLSLKKASSSLQNYKNTTARCIQPCEEAVNCLKGNIKARAAEMLEICMEGARLRKIASVVACEIDQATSGVITESHITLQVCTIRIVYAFLAFMQRYLTIVVVQSSMSVGDENQPIINTAIKTIESVLNVEKCSVTSSTLLQDETYDALARCMLMADIVEDNDTVETNKVLHKFVTNVRVRVSNIFWARYLKAVSHHVAVAERIQLLEKSVEALLGRSIHEQQVAWIALKYEKLAQHFLEKNEHARALESLRRALRFYIKSGVLSRAAEAAMTRPAKQTWSIADSQIYAFGTVLNMYAGTSFAQQAQTGPSYKPYEDAELSAIERCVLLQKQLDAILSRGPSPVPISSIHPVIQQMLMFTGHVQDKVYQLRTVSWLLAQSATSGSDAIGGMLDGSAIEGFCQKVTSDGSAPKPNEICLRSVVRLQWLLLSGQADLHSLTNIVNDLSPAIMHTNDSEALESIADDVEILLNQLRAVLNYATMLDDTSLSLSLLQLINHVLRLQPGFEQVSYPYLVQLAKLHNRQGETELAGRTFALAERLIPKIEREPLTVAEFHLARGDYLLNLDDTPGCLDALLQAKRAFNDMSSEAGQPVSSRHKLRKQSVLCSAVLLASQLAARNCQSTEACTYARQAVKLSTAIWLTLGKACKIVGKVSSQLSDESSLHNLTQDMSSLNLSMQQSAPQHPAKGAAYWPYVHLHFSVLCNMMIVSMQNGLYQDAFYYAEQSRNISMSLAAEELCARANLMLALLQTRRNEPRQANEFLRLLPPLKEDKASALNAGESLLDRAEVHLYLHDVEAAETCIRMATRALPEAARKILDTTKTEQTKSKAKTQQIKPTRKVPSKKTIPKVSISAKREAVNAGKDATIVPPTHTNHQLRSFLDRLIKLRIDLNLSQQELDVKATEVVVRYPGTSHQPERSVSEAKYLLQKAFQLFSSDAVNCVLSETAIALPVKYRSARHSGRVSFIQATPQRPMVQDVSDLKSGSTATGSGASQGQMLLSEAYKLLVSANVPATQTSTFTVHLMSQLLWKLTLLGAATSSPFIYSSAHLVLQALRSKDEARSREISTIVAENETTNREQVEKWPTPQIATTDTKDSNDTFNVDSLPTSWTVNSVSLDHEKQELLIARIAGGRSPFLVRIPLTRPTADDDEEAGEFTYEAAKAQLVDIVAQANESAHDTRGSADKATRKAWYGEREALDARLEALLANMENIWLGGFRGLLSSAHVDESLLSRFGQSLLQTLDKHLPSRQKAAKASSARVVLHAHVLELFVTIGHPDEAELDDAISDLLYFVVDILQFSGERNAYDEIDFDAMLVEVIDALRCYHEAASVQPLTSRHTILVLDKELQAFPWESLPIMKGTSVSRMPSLGAITDGLTKIRNQSLTAQAYTIPCTAGGYMLNPSSDLLSTQATFEPTLTTQLPTFTRSINRPPSEADFEACLRDHALFLYFGHGSGAQYIRGRTVRKMKQCAVTLLMGCSSGKLTECGLFESYGTPWNYLYAGSMAVVGTLWDVTDRDIDRFAMGVLGEWGLIDEPEEEEKGKGKAKARAKKAKVEKKAGKESRKGVVGLDQAVSAARERCLLKYLNGAAPVVYGLPVVLGD